MPCNGHALALLTHSEENVSKILSAEDRGGLLSNIKSLNYAVIGPSCLHHVELH